MGRISHEVKLRIIQMYMNGSSDASIHRELRSFDHTVSSDTISYWIHKYDIGLFGCTREPDISKVVSSVTLRDTELIKEYISNDYTCRARKSIEC